MKLIMLFTLLISTTALSQDKRDYLLGF